MHIAIATAEFVTEKTFGGGLANYSANLAKLLKKNGHQISVFVPSFEETEFVWEDDIKVYRVLIDDMPNRFNKIKKGFVKRCILVIWNLVGKSFLINKKIKSVNKVHEIDVVHFCSSESLALFRNSKIPAVVRISTYLATMKQAQKPSFDFKRSINQLGVVEKIQFLAMKRADYIFGPSYNAARLTEQKIKKQVEVIESPFFIDKNKLDFSLYDEWLNKKKYFLFYGTLGYLKGIHIIAEILDRIFENYPDYYFVFIGNSQKMIFANEEVDAIEYIYRSAPKYRDKIIYFNAVQDKGRLYGIVQRAEACILPSRFDNLPNTCIESMALGKIVVGTNGASFEQLIDDGINGFLIEREDAEQLYDKISVIIGLKADEREAIGKRASETVLRLEPDKIYVKLFGIYQKAIEKR